MTTPNLPDPTTIRRVLVAGDVHGSKKFVASLAKNAYKQNTQVILQLGDFGYWEHQPDGVRFLDYVNSELDRKAKGGVGRDLWLVWLDGNHENHELLWTKYAPIEEGPWAGFVRLRDRILYAPRNHTWTWGGRTFMALGGAESIDKDTRVEGFDWWRTELITWHDMQVASDTINQLDQLDVLATHDAPSQADVPDDPHARVKFDITKHPASAANRRALGMVVAEATPQLAVHGHMHVRYDDTHIHDDGRTTHIAGFACDQQGDRRGWGVLDLNEGTLEGTPVFTH